MDLCVLFVVFPTCSTSYIWIYVKKLLNMNQSTIRTPKNPKWEVRYCCLMSEAMTTIPCENGKISPDLFLDKLRFSDKDGMMRKAPLSECFVVEQLSDGWRTSDSTTMENLPRPPSPATAPAPGSPFLNYSSPLFQLLLSAGSPN